MQLSRLVSYFLAAQFFLAQPGQAIALEFSTLDSKPGLVVLTANGVIENGDVARFLSVAPFATQDGNGYRRIVLRSPGGDVAVAMRVAVELRQWNFITFVDADCASACAMILYPAGVYSILGDKGRLGFHNCYSTRTENIVPECTEAIAQFAKRQGMPYGSIKILAGLRGAGEMLWVTNVLAHCYGMERLPGDQAPVTVSTLCAHVALTLIDAKQINSSSIGPSFDCRKAEEPIGMLLCTDEELMHLDALMGHLYQFARRLDTSPEQVVLQSQRAWIKNRKAACPINHEELQSLVRSRQATRCISEKTMLRMDELLKMTGRPRLDFSRLLEYGREGWAPK
jgi:uncharacterized protein YecT (DUF1311 family)